jgi:hypothetical protein
MKKTMTLIVLAVLTLGIMNCGGNAEKKSVIKFLDRSIEIMKTDEYKKQGNFEDMTNKVLVECGFKTFQDFDNALKKYATDTEVMTKCVEYAKIQGGSEN